MDALGEAPRSVAGGLLGIARGKQGIPEEEIEFFRYSMATATASAVRMAMKALYLLDSANVETVEMPLSRQARRHASRKGKKISWTIAVRPSKKSREVEGEQSSSFSHRFEVRGNFAHYREGSWLYEHSPSEEIRACPRCGHCRRVWRPPHIKGPADKPLAIKVRRIEFADEDPD
ncbi:MAG TPA: hypothetical protein VNY83_04665 [Solirubrobacterales bacterium]|nr:hypothetical protein [Solirubrobacterales bacterium]